MTSYPCVHVVTDSTASLAVPAAAPWAARLHIVPLQIIVEDVTFAEGLDITPLEVADLLTAGQRLTTSQPSPRAFLETFTAAEAAGATGIVSVHLSGELSGTVSAAALAAEQVGIPVRVVDSRTVAMSLGFAAMTAAETAAGGADLDEVAARAQEVAEPSRAIFMVDSLDHLRRGGRLGATAAALGTVLGVRPLLAVRGGRIEIVQKVRTRAVAVDRLVDVAVESAGRRREPVLAVHFLGSDVLAQEVAERLRERTGAEVGVSPVSAVIGAHVGPGVLGIMIADHAPVVPID